MVLFVALRYLVLASLLAAAAAQVGYAKKGYDAMIPSENLYRDGNIFREPNPYEWEKLVARKSWLIGSLQHRSASAGMGVSDPAVAQNFPARQYKRTGSYAPRLSNGHLGPPYMSHLEKLPKPRMVMPYFLGPLSDWYFPFWMPHLHAPMSYPYGWWLYPWGAWLSVGPMYANFLMSAHLSHHIWLSYLPYVLYGLWSPNSIPFKWPNKAGNSAAQAVANNMVAVPPATQAPAAAMMPPQQSMFSVPQFSVPQPPTPRFAAPAPSAMAMLWPPTQPRAAQWPMLQSFARWTPTIQPATQWPRQTTAQWKSNTAPLPPLAVPQWQAVWQPQLWGICQPGILSQPLPLPQYTLQASDFERITKGLVAKF